MEKVVHSLNHYTELKQTELFDRTGAFFAFGDEQFKSQAKEGVKYCSMGAGLICPKENAKTLFSELGKIHAAGVKMRLQECGKKAIILYELNNYECFYTGRIDDVLELLAEYGATEQEVLSVFRANQDKYD